MENIILDLFKGELSFLAYWLYFIGYSPCRHLCGQAIMTRTNDPTVLFRRADAASSFPGDRYLFQPLPGNKAKKTESTFTVNSV